MLGPAYGALAVRLDLEQPYLSHALEVGPDSVGMEVETLGDLGGRQRDRGARQLKENGVPRVVAKGLEHR
jgi:hypothetical protein